MEPADSMNPADRELLARVGSGDAEALSLLYDRYAARVLGLLLRLLGRRDDAEDVLQETFVQVWRKAYRFDPTRGTPLVWILMIARSRALDMLRSRGGRAAVATAAEPADLGDFLDRLEHSEATARIGAALAVLPGPQRESLVLSFYDGMSHTEIARNQGVSLGTAKSRIRLGLNKLRELLDDPREGEN